MMRDALGKRKDVKRARARAIYWLQVRAGGFFYSSAFSGVRFPASAGEEVNPLSWIIDPFIGSPTKRSALRGVCIVA